MGRASKDKRDIYYRKAKEEGYRARSAYKLLQIHEDFNILNAHDIATGAVDLCAAPGSWCQVLSSHFRRIEAERKTAGTTANTDTTVADARGQGPLKPRVVAVDLQEMAPIEGVRLLQGDITSEATAREIIRLLNADSESESESDDDDDAKENAEGGEKTTDTAHQAVNEEEEADSHAAHADRRANRCPASSSPSSSNMRKADIVVCDGAPDVTGMHELDEYLQHHLLLAALNITTFVLRPGGTFVTKMFRGPNTPFLVAKSELFFDQVRVVKPKSSRNASMECFLLCQNFRLPEGYAPHFTSSTTTHTEDNSTITTPAVEGGAQLTSDAPVYTYQSDKNAPHHAPPPPGQDAATAEKTILPFLSCGDLSGFDADMCYDRAQGVDVLAPVQPPLQAPYLAPHATTAREPVATECKRARTE